jgi:hypothetical protein
MKKVILLAPLMLLAGCAGKISYTPPASTASANNTALIDAPIDTVWAAAVPKLSKQFFVINNLDKASGLINVSYTGDPEKYVDCGQISSYVNNLHGARTYVFPAASAFKAYEVLVNGQYAQINRKMELEGRVNLIFEAVNKNQTRVSAHTKYVVTKTITSPNFAGTDKNSVDFNTGGSGMFAGPTPATVCRATGALEQEILKAVSSDQ